MQDEPQRDRARPEYWDGTLLKCPGCRCKFPFSAASHEFRYGAGPADAPRRAQPAAMTRCPQCDRPVTMT